MVWMLSFSAIGMPCSGPRILPASRSRSRASACSSALGLTVITALSRPHRWRCASGTAYDFAGGRAPVLHCGLHVGNGRFDDGEGRFLCGCGRDLRLTAPAASRRHKAEGRNGRQLAWWAILTSAPVAPAVQILRMARTNRFGQPIGEAVYGLDATAVPAAHADGGALLQARAVDAGTCGDAVGRVCRRRRTKLDLPRAGTVRTGRRPPGVRDAVGGQHRSAVLRDRRADGSCGWHPRTYASPRPPGRSKWGTSTSRPRLQRTPAATEAMYLMMRRSSSWATGATNGNATPSTRRRGAPAQRLGFSYEGIFRQALVPRAATATRHGTPASIRNGRRSAAPSARGSRRTTSTRPVSSASLSPS